MTASPAAASSPDPDRNATLGRREFEKLVGSVPVVTPRAELAYEAVVDIAASEELGDGPWGERRMVPITGGRFAGPRISGTVRAGGADRQIIRADGVKMLAATYELEADDGAVITVVNHAIIEESSEGRYARSWLEVTAPIGPHDWLNKRVLVGTVDSLKPARDAVLIRTFVLG